MKRNEGLPRMDSSAKAAGESRRVEGEDGGTCAVNAMPEACKNARVAENVGNTFK